jgi:hypothetical protein
MLRTTLFVDFGNVTNPVVQITAGDLFNIAAGPDLVMPDAMAMPPFPPTSTPLYSPTTLLTFQPLQTVLRNQGIDFNGDGAVNAADFQALHDSVLSILQRIFQPYDVQIQEVNATSAAGIAGLLAGQPGSAYVFAGGVLSGMGGGTMGPLAGTVAGDRQAESANMNANPPDPGTVIFGDASTIDETAGGNATSESALVYADALAAYSSDLTFGYPLDVAMANVIAREAGFTYGLLPTRRNLVSSSDVTPLDAESADPNATPGTPDNSTLLNIGQFSRYPLLTTQSRVAGNPKAMPPVPQSLGPKTTN